MSDKIVPADIVLPLYEFEIVNVPLIVLEKELRLTDDPTADAKPEGPEPPEGADKLDP